MRLSRIKTIAAIVLTVLSLGGIYGISKLYAIAENITFNADAFSAYSDQEFEGAKYNEKIQNDAKKAAKSVLGGSINTRVSQFCGKEDIIVCYTKNVYIEFDTISMDPVYLIYECKAGNPKYDLKDCQRIAVMFAFRNMPKKLKPNDALVYCDDIVNSVAKYHINFGKGNIFVDIRMDTGSVVFYDASENFK